MHGNFLVRRPPFQSAISLGCLLVFGALAVATQPASAQSIDGSRSTLPSAFFEARWSAAVGIDPFEFDLRTRDPGVRGQLFGVLARHWSPSGSGLAARAQLTIGADLPRGYRVGNSEACGCVVGVSRSFGAFGTLATYEWRRARLLRPYVLGGPSLHAERTGWSVERGPLTLAAASEVPLRPSRTRWSLGVGGGAGVAFAVGPSDLFIEQSIQVPDLRRSDRVFQPLSIGFRF